MQKNAMGFDYWFHTHLDFRKTYEWRPCFFPSTSGMARKGGQSPGWHHALYGTRHIIEMARETMAGAATQLRHFDPTAIKRIRTAGVKPAARRRVARARDVAGEHDPPPLRRRIGLRHRRQ